jgi:hypothetical protein
MVLSRIVGGIEHQGEPRRESSKKDRWLTFFQKSPGYQPAIKLASRPKKREKAQCDDGKGAKYAAADISRRRNTRAPPMG